MPRAGAGYGRTPRSPEATVGPLIARALRMVNPAQHTAATTTARPEAPVAWSMELGPFGVRQRGRSAYDLEGARANAIQRSPGATYELTAKVSGNHDEGPGDLRLAFFDAKGAVLAERPFPKGGVSRVDPGDVPGASSFGLLVPQTLSEASVSHTLRTNAPTMEVPAVTVRAKSTAQIDDPRGSFRAHQTLPTAIRADQVYNFRATSAPYDNTNEPVGYDKLKVSVFDGATGKVREIPFGPDGKLSLRGSDFPPGSELGLSAAVDVTGRAQLEVKPAALKAGTPAAGDAFDRTKGSPTVIPGKPVALPPADPGLVQELEAVRRAPGNRV